MAGRIKHMQRSHYSYRNNTAEKAFLGFERKAVTKENNKYLKNKSGFGLFVDRIKKAANKMLQKDQSK